MSFLVLIDIKKVDCAYKVTRFKNYHFIVADICQKETNETRRTKCSV